jgi:hypothetical protein
LFVYRLRLRASTPKRAMELQEATIRDCALEATRTQGIYEKLKFAYEILDKMVLPYHLCAPGLSAKSAFSA